MEVQSALLDMDADKRQAPWWGHCLRVDAYAGSNTKAGTAEETVLLESTDIEADNPDNGAGIAENLSSW